MEDQVIRLSDSEILLSLGINPYALSNSQITQIIFALKKTGKIVLDMIASPNPESLFEFEEKLGQNKEQKKEFLEILLKPSEGESTVQVDEFISRRDFNIFQEKLCRMIEGRLIRRDIKEKEKEEKELKEKEKEKERKKKLEKEKEEEEEKKKKDAEESTPPFLYSPSLVEEEAQTDGLKKFSFLGSGYHTVVLDRQITKGIFQWKVRISYPSTRDQDFCLGALPFGSKSRVLNDKLGILPGTICFAFWISPSGPYRSALYGVEGGRYSDSRADFSADETPVPDNALVALEINADKHTLCFAVNGKKVPRAYHEIDSKLILGMSGYRGSSFVSESFQKMLFPTLSLAACKYYKPL